MWPLHKGGKAFIVVGPLKKKNCYFVAASVIYKWDKTSWTYIIYIYIFLVKLNPFNLKKTNKRKVCCLPWNPWNAWRLTPWIWTHGFPPIREGRLKDLPGSLAGNNGRRLQGQNTVCVCVDGRKEEVKNPFQCVRNFASGIYIYARCV